MEKYSLFIISLLCLSLSYGCGTTTSTASLSTNEKKDVTSYTISNAQLGNSVLSEIGGALILNDGMRNEDASFPCEISGDITLHENESNPSNNDTIYNECIFLIDANTDFNIDGQYITYNGTISNEGGTGTYTSFRIEQRPLSSLAVNTCTLSGTTTAVASTVNDGAVSATAVTYNMTATCDYTTIHHTGTLIGHLATGGGTFYLDGSAHYTITSSATGQSTTVDCSYSNFNVTTASCPHFATACGLDPQDSCR